MRRKWTDEQFVEAVRNSNSIAQVLGALGLKVTGANYKTFSITATRLGIDHSHFQGKAYLKGKTHSWNAKSFKDILVLNSSFNNSAHLKRRLIKAGLLEDKCSICGQLPFWNGKPLVLQLDHINGSNTDNRIENLRIVCGHCHSQTETFAGRNRWPRSDSN